MGAAAHFGASVQLTGPVANTGRYYKDAYEFVVEKINAAGGIKIGAEHRKIALNVLDNQSDVNLSVRPYVQLLSQDKVNFLLGPFASNFVLADSSIAEKSLVPMVQGGGASDQIYSRGYNYIFGKRREMNPLSGRGPRFKVKPTMRSVHGPSNLSGRDT